VLPSDYLKRLRRVEYKARLASEQLVGGRLPSVFRGRGMDFADVREYTPGDDVRRIDWNVTARLRKPFIKRHVEERELVVVLAVDVSASGHFGSAPAGLAEAESMRELAAIAAGAIAFAATRAGDRVGLLTFTDRVERWVPPRKTRPHVSRMLHELLFGTPRARSTSIDIPLKFLLDALRRPALVFLFSDFHDDAFDRWHATLKAANQRHEVLAFPLADRREFELPDVGVARVEDAETGEIVEIDTSDPAVRLAWARVGASRSAHLTAAFRSARVPALTLHCDRPWAHALRTFLAQAAKRRIA
jgi:uncharacterized protein (DUF58 family)